MTISRDFSGRLVASMPAAGGNVLEVVRERSGRYAVDSVGDCIRSRAVLLPLWDRSPVFASFVQAVRWMKENAPDLY